MLSREECEEIYIDELDISKELKEKIFLRASYIHELVTAYDVLRFNPNEYLEKELNKNREKIITIEDEIESLYGKEISGLIIYHPISANKPFEYEEQEFYFCSSCESVIAPEQKKLIDDLTYECALNEGVEAAEEKFGGLCPLCNKKKSLYLQNIHCAKANKLIEKSQSLIDAEKYEEACECKKSILHMLIYVCDALVKVAMVGLVCNVCLWTWHAMQEETIALQGHSSIEVIDSEEDLWGCNKKGLLLLKEDIFSLMSKQEQVDVLQFFVDLECAYLGCNSVQLEIYEFENEMILGSYNNEERVIRIGNSLLEEGSYACIPVLLHEIFHVYEHACVEEIDLESIDNTNLKLYEILFKWKEEMEHYESAGSYSAKEQHIEYVTQSIELYADMYSEKWSENYIEYIDGLEE